MPRSSWSVPPDFRGSPDEFWEMFLEMFNDFYGLGDDRSGSLDSDNIPESTISSSTGVSTNTALAHTKGTDQGLDIGGPSATTAVDLKDAVTKKHDPLGNHKIMVQAASLSNAISSTVNVVSPNAIDLATVINLANEEKADINTLVSDLNGLVSKVNTLLANLRTAKLQG